MIKVLGPGYVKLDFGPVQMTINVSGEGAGSGVAEEAALHAVAVIRSLAAVKEVAALPQEMIGDAGDLPEVLRRMVAAVRASGDGDLTPMAAVAGTVADMTADWLAARGIPKVIVNNGGDIAIRLQPGHSACVGIAPGLGLPHTHVLAVHAGDGIGGVATSGLGGRSFTKGIATAAVAAAESAALADACATSLGNATFAPHPAIRRVAAHEVDPLTDIAGHLVVREVGELPPDVIRAALAGGSHRAGQLYGRGIIKGAAIFINHWGVMVPEDLAAPVPNISVKEGLAWRFAR